MTKNNDVKITGNSKGKVTGSVQPKDGKLYAVINLYENGERKPRWIDTGVKIPANKKNLHKAEESAKNICKEMCLDWQKKIYAPEDVKLFSDFLIEWLELKNMQLDSITYESYKEIIDRHIYPYFKEKDLKVKDVTTDVLQEFVNFKNTKGRLDGKGGLSAKTIREFMNIIKQSCNFAVKKELLATNPCSDVVLPKKIKIQTNWFDAETINTFLDKIKDEELYPLILFTVKLGLRRSEVLGLRWSSLNNEMSTITINHTVVRHTETHHKDTTKNKTSFRTYPITNELKILLKELKAKEEDNRRNFGSSYIENDYIFKWANGNPYSPDYVTSKFSKLLRKHNLPHIRFHDLRHSCASILLNSGYRLKDVQEWLGHADIQTTANFYGHINFDRKIEIAEGMSEIMKR